MIQIIGQITNHLLKNYWLPNNFKQTSRQELYLRLIQNKITNLNRFTDPSFGNARGSDYELFQDNEKITGDLKKDLVSITQKIFNTDGFFVILFL